LEIDSEPRGDARSQVATGNGWTLSAATPPLETADVAIPGAVQPELEIAPYRSLAGAGGYAAQPAAEIGVTEQPAEAAESNETGAVVSLEAPDVALETPASPKKATRVNMPTGNVNTAGPAREQQNPPGDRNAKTRGWRNSPGDHERDGLAGAHNARCDERRRLAGKEICIGRDQREDRQQPQVLD
jgi:hypothetical protein